MSAVRFRVASAACVLLSVGLASSAAAQCPPVIEVQKITAFDATAGDNLGDRVSISGDFMFVSSIKDDDAGANSGSVYVYRRVNDEYIFEQKLVAADGQAEDRFGISIDVLGTLAVIGADLEDQRGTSAGAAYVFEFDGTQWNQTSKIAPTDLTSFQQFGNRVHIIDNERILINRVFDSTGGGTNVGSIYEFRRSGGTWVECQRIRPALQVANSGQFGLGMDTEGNTLVVGAGAWDQFGADAGAVIVFEYHGTFWFETQTLIGSDSGVGDGFGGNVVIENGFIISQSSRNDTAGSDAGAAYVFQFDGNNWSETQRLAPPGLETDDRFGFFIAIDGNVAAIAAVGDDDAGADAGAVYLYRFDGSAWIEGEKIIPADASPGDLFGNGRFDLSFPILTVSAPLVDTPTTDAGAVYVFNLDPSPTTIDVGPINQNVAVGGNAVFTVTATGTPPLQYQWRFNGQPIPVGAPFFSGSTTDTLTVSPVFLGMGGSVDVVVSNLCSGSATSNSATLASFDPCPADLNDDNQVDFFDILTYLNLFATGCP